MLIKMDKFNKQPVRRGCGTPASSARRRCGFGSTQQQPSTSRKVERGHRRSLHSSVHEERKRQQHKLRHEMLRLETRRKKPFHYQDSSDGSDQGPGRLGSLWPGKFHSLAEWSPEQPEPQLSLLGEGGNDTWHDNDTGHLPCCQHQQ